MHINEVVFRASHKYYKKKNIAGLGDWHRSMEAYAHEW